MFNLKPYISLPFLAGKQKITTIQIFNFLHKLEILLKANIPLLNSIETLERSEQVLIMKKQLFYVKRDLVAGKRISESFGCFRDSVEPFFFQLLKIGEETGRLDWTIKQLLHDLGLKISFQKKIKAALFYPTIVLIIACMLFFALFIFIIPEFAKLFLESNLTLPFYTQMIFWIANFLKNHSLLFIVMAIILFIVFKLLSQKLHTTIFQLISHFKLVKKCRYQMHLVRFCQQLAICLTAGVSLLEALNLLQAHHFHNNDHIITRISKQIKRGQSLSFAMAEHDCFPHFMIEMIRVGESAGMLDQVLLYVGKYYQDELETFFMKLKSILEPLIICFLGVLIGGLVFSIYMPIFRLGSVWQ